MKIGLFGGTFNPVHFGHINLAIELMERHGLDTVWWIPANISPFRQNEEVASAHHRMQMVKRAIQDIPQFKVLDLEIKRAAPSYTIDTLDAVVDKKNSYYLLLADDTFATFDKWKESEKIKEKVEILVANRTGKGAIPLMEISGTRIRERLKKDLYCAHLLPLIVLDYIRENQLYFSP